MEMFTIQMIESYCKELSKKVGDTFNVPVFINGRLTRTLGRAFEENVNGIWKPIKIEFSRRFLETSTDECVKSVIEHEWSHYYTTKRTGESHGHDGVFKATCRMIGCQNDGTSTKVERTVSEEQMHKYVVYCDKCKEPLGYFSRMCATLKNIDNCTCGKCGHDKIHYVQNW